MLVQLSSRSARTIHWPFRPLPQARSDAATAGRTRPVSSGRCKTADRRAFGRVGAQLSRCLRRSFINSLAYFGACRPGELIHSSMWDAVSAWRALRIRSSLSAPAGSPEALSRASFANAERRSFNDCDCLKRRLVFTTLLSCLRWGGARGVLVTDGSHGPGGDTANLSLFCRARHNKG